MPWMWEQSLQRDAAFTPCQSKHRFFRVTFSCPWSLLLSGGNPQPEINAVAAQINFTSTRYFFKLCYQEDFTHCCFKSPGNMKIPFSLHLFIFINHVLIFLFFSAVGRNSKSMQLPFIVLYMYCMCQCQGLYVYLSVRSGVIVLTLSVFPIKLS